MKFFVDLNSDIGEGYGAYKLGMDEEIMKCVTSVNCACGWHAGDPLIMDKTIKIAKEKNVAVGGKVFFTEYKNDVKDGRLIISIGDVLTFSFLLNSNNLDCRATFRCCPKTLDDSIKDAEFILALDKEECLSFGDFPLHLKVNEQDLVKALTKRIEE